MTANRAGLAEFFRRQTDKMRTYWGNPTSGDRAFVRDVHADLVLAMENAQETSSYSHLSSHRDMVEEKYQSMKNIEHWFFEWVSGKPRHWRGKLKLMLSLRTALATGCLVLDDMDAVESLEMMFCSYLKEIPQMVEYYVNTGEIVELLDTFRDERGELDTSSFYNDSAATMVTIYRLYCYDVSRVKECLDTGVDPVDHMRVPLEIRMEFAGCSQVEKQNPRDNPPPHKGLPLEEKMHSYVFWDYVVSGYENIVGAVNHHYVLPRDVFDTFVYDGYALT